MSQRPTSFAQLLRRVSSPRSAASQGGPLLATATEVTSPPAVGESPLWVILHSVTDSDVRLIHPRPVAASKLAVQIRSDAGEILRVTLAMAGSQKIGELYESTAQFLQ